MTEPQPRKLFGLWSGVGVVIANMVGSGVFLSFGYMAQSLPPGPLLLAWVIGAVLALSGAYAYAEVARLVPRSGGEYRYLSQLLHPALGYLAGWASLLVGFSAPIAVDALGAGAYLATVIPGTPPTAVAVGLVVGLTAVHAVGLHLSARAQNVLVIVKVVLVLGFVVLGLAAGTVAWPTWVPPTPTDGFPLKEMVGSLFFIAFAFSGWNAAVYAAEEFDDPSRTVPRAMLIGCGLVAALYLVVNYIFAANLTPAEGAIVFQGNNVTVGHALMNRLLGEGVASLMSLIIVLAFVSAMSAMIMIGPRVYSAMAKDGFLPKGFIGVDGKPPTMSVLLQGGIALVLVFTQSLKEALTNVGAILVLFAALTVLGLFRARLQGKDVKSSALVAAGVYCVSAAFMLWTGFKDKLPLLAGVAGVTVVGLIGWTLTRRPAKVATP
ncbi:MAG: amino acid permease-associated region [Myxococcaceae bacterium]|nr:amino acid permease-associated region [Myxococcaceae bacterium]